ncbi:hypothetical protein G647_07525 [Cladophialophora carrionii CBS 160.54]|uniref:RNA exonuclease 4 n=1 Tax=Cladophialophora carrionii CBS 160.54 TaxID=1279043 RepID=V9D3D8_9EURO|nr:uncharacterized protein G647_07525 [Cladophialophora carrionii CBS 160.54]ETI21181.1 hypothetical protein G647_07525 [Cladophialophora carrionii CBS 160.54]
MDLNTLSANWKKLQATLKTSTTGISPRTTSSQHGIKRKRDHSQRTTRESLAEAPKTRKRLRVGRSMAQNGNNSVGRMSVKEAENNDNVPRPRPATLAASDKVNAGLSPEVEIGRYVALDCEMVGVGPNPDKESALARVSIVNYNGDQVYDSYVLPLEPVTDYRTHVSGISAKHIKVARPLKEVQADVVKILQDRVLIGHSIKHDLAALMLSHPQRDVRDTSRHPPYRKVAGGSYPKLKILASELLGTDIQEGEHSSVEDARACMMLFRKDKAVFEREHSKRWPTQAPIQTQQEVDAPTKPRKHKKKKKKH